MVNRRQQYLVGAAVAWTAFVWFGRIRNALADEALDSGARLATVALSMSMLLPAAVVAILAWRERRGGPTPALRIASMVTLAWVTGLWAMRVIDIALFGDHAAAFVVIHVTLGVVSVALWLGAVLALVETSSEQISFSN